MENIWSGEMSSPETNPTQADGEWYDTDDELVEGLRKEIEALDKRKAYLESIIEEVVNRVG
jgi:hypothetical protein